MSTIISSSPDNELFSKELISSLDFSSNATICCDTPTLFPQSSNGYCSDHSDCDSWGPNKFEVQGGITQIQNAHAGAEIREMPAGYCMAGLMRELTANTETDNALFVIDLSTVMRKLGDWREHLPRVKPHYAIKCNNDEVICRMLAQAGCGFDCASKDELAQCLAMGVPANSLIYANPCKQTSMLRYARAVGVRKMTADNVEELHKIHAVFPEASIVLRIAVDDSKSVCRFNSKFGAPEHEWDSLLSTAKALDLDIMGISFHVGSGCGDLKPFADAVASARDAFDLARSYGFNPTLLDCGGGWPGSDDGTFTFAQLANVVGEAIDHYFPASCGVEIMAEPGRYMVCASHTYSVAVIAKRQLSASQLADTAGIESFGAKAVSSKDSEDIITSHHDDGFKKTEASNETPEVALYINDGVYGSFNCVVFDHAEVEPIPLLPRAGAKLTKLFGPTCDSIDVVMGCTRLPEMHIGDWLMFEKMGAYTRCAASRFNGQGAHDLHYIWAGMP